MTQILPHLTPRENQMCALVAQGQSNKQIAAEMKISPDNVKEKLGRIFLKTRCHGRTELAVCYVQGASAKPTRANQSTKNALRGERKK